MIDQEPGVGNVSAPVAAIGAEDGRYIVTVRTEVMENTNVVAALSALAQEHRLAVFRLLVQAGEDGMPAGAIAQALEIPNSSLSFHLAQLSRAGLISQERKHRSLIYRADYGSMSAVVDYLMENCCQGACPPAPPAGQQTTQNERKKA